MSFIPRRDDAEEVLQRSAVSLWEKFGEYDRSRDFLPWAMRFAYLEVLKFRKEQARNRLLFNVEVLDLIHETRRILEPELERQRGALRACLKNVDEVGILILKRRYCDSESIGDLAEEHGQTVKALYRKLDRIRDTLARCIKRRVLTELE